MSEIDFPPQEHLDGSSDLISFPAVVDGQTVPCAVEVEALQDACHAGQDDPLRVFREYRPSIEAAAARLIENGRFEHNGGVLVTAQDL